MALLDDVRCLAAIYRSARRISVGRTSRLVFGDGTKLDGILSGNADLTTRRYERTVAWFSDHWPDNVDWPSNVRRPVVMKNKVKVMPSSTETAV